MNEVKSTSKHLWGAVCAKGSAAGYEGAEKNDELIAMLGYLPTVNTSAQGQIYYQNRHDWCRYLDSGGQIGSPWATGGGKPEVEAIRGPPSARITPYEQGGLPQVSESSTLQQSGHLLTEQVVFPFDERRHHGVLLLAVRPQEGNVLEFCAQGLAHLGGISRRKRYVGRWQWCFNSRSSDSCSLGR